MLLFLMAKVPCYMHNGTTENQGKLLFYARMQLNFNCVPPTYPESKTG